MTNGYGFFPNHASTISVHYTRTYVCMYMYVSTVCMYTYVCMYMYIHVHVCTCMYVCMYTYIRMYVHVHTCTYMYMYVCIYVHVHMYVCTYTYAQLSLVYPTASAPQKTVGLYTTQ